MSKAKIAERRTVAISRDAYDKLTALIKAIKAKGCSTCQTDVLDAVILNASPDDPKLIETVQGFREEKLALREERKELRSVLKGVSTDKLKQVLAALNE